MINTRMKIMILYAQVSVTDGNYFGASAWLNVWKPATFNSEFSLAQIWVWSGQGDEVNAVEAGWQVSFFSHGRFLFHIISLPLF